MGNISLELKKRAAGMLCAYPGRHAAWT